MIKSRKFWMAAILLAIIPLMLTDIAVHLLSWKSEVREELIGLVQDSYNYTRQEKATLLDRVFDRNKSLVLYICIKTVLSLVFLVWSFYLFRAYQKKYRPAVWQPILLTLLTMAAFMSVKLFAPDLTAGNKMISEIRLPENEYSFRNLYNTYFKGQVVYVDFWGTTCPPCLIEFRDFTPMMKKRFKQRQDINYLYVSHGSKYLWRKQTEKYGVNGYHIFLSDDQWDQLYRRSVNEDTGMIYMPRYLIIDKTGAIVDREAKPPSKKDSLYADLEGYLSKH